MLNEEELEELKTLVRRNQYIVHGDTAEADCVLAFSFGNIQDESTILPGKSNIQIANFIEQQLQNIPVIAQFEIADALHSCVPEYVIRHHRTPEKYLDSGEVAAQALLHMKSKGWNKAIIVTHPALEARNDYACTALGITTIAPAGLEVIEYDEASSQPWTRTPTEWWSREEGIIDLCYANSWLSKPVTVSNGGK